MFVAVTCNFFQAYTSSKYAWKKLQDAKVRQRFQLELSNRFEVLQCSDTSLPITQRYDQFENAVSEAAEKVVGKHSSCGLPSWVTDKTTKLKLERDEAKKRYIVSKSKQSRACWRRLNSELNESYKLDEAAMLNKQIEDLKLADTKGDYTTTWKIIHELSGKGKKTSVKVKKEMALHQLAIKSYFQSGRNTSVPCLTTAVVNHHQNFPFLLPRTSRSRPIHQHEMRQY